MVTVIKLASKASVVHSIRYTGRKVLNPRIKEGCAMSDSQFIFTNRLFKKWYAITITTATGSSRRVMLQEKNKASKDERA